MKLHVWGTDFRRSSSDFRAKLGCSAETRGQIVRDLHALGFTDLVYLSTCNRVEFYTTAPDHFVDMRPRWLALLQYFGIGPEGYYQGFHFEGKAALRHLLRVACSLESLVVGEPQILGQLKESLAWNKDNGFVVDKELERFFQLAFETARRVRAETAIAEKSVSVASLGISHFTKREKEVPLQEVAVVGRSPISVLIVQWMQKNRPDVKVHWANRNVEALQSYAETQSSTVKLWSLSDFLANPPTHSHLFTATSSQEAIFGDDFFSRLTEVPKLVFDFAQPPDVHLEKEEFLRQIKVVNLQGLEAEAAENRQQRILSVVEAETYVESALRGYCQQQKEAPLLKEFSSVEPVLVENLRQALNALSADFQPESLPAVQRWAESLVKKQLHCSREHLRNVLNQLAGESKAPLM